MRNKNQQLTDREARGLLEAGEYGILSLVSTDGTPRGIPLNYCVLDDSIFFHCAIEGEKIQCLEAHPTVSFCVVGHTEVLPEKFTTRYESCIVRGAATECFAQEKQYGLEGLIRKYSPDVFHAGLSYIEEGAAETRVFSISIDSISAKACR